MLINQDLEFELSKQNNTQLLNIVMHGFDSSMQSRSVSSLCKKLQDLSQNTLRFSFLGHGNSKGELSKNNISSQIQNLHQVILYAQSQGYTDFNLVGSSFSAQVALNYAQQHPELIQKVALKCPLINGYDLFKETLSPQAIADWQDSNQHLHPRHDQSYVSLPYSFLLDFEKHNPYKFLASFPAQLLIVHGDRDQTVPLEQSLAAQKLLPSLKLVVVEGADHRFKDSQHFQQMQEAILEFLTSN